MKLPDENEYYGEWKEGKKQGMGVLIWPDQKKYIGQFEDDKMNGYGTCYFSNG